LTANYQFECLAKHPHVERMLCFFGKTSWLFMECNGEALASLLEDKYRG